MGPIYVAINLMNLALFGFLVLTFIKIYKTSKASFSLGLILFWGFLMIHSLISVYLYIAMSNFFADLLIPYLIAISLTELVGVGIFLKITLNR